MSPGPTTGLVRIPADVEREDRVLAGLTARQLAILTVTGVILYGGWTASRALLPPLTFLLVTTPIAVCVAILALGSRDGVSLDRLLLAAIRQRLTPRRQVAAPDGVRPVPDWLAPHQADARPAELALPARDLTDGGVIDLGRDGLAVVATATTVNFALRTQAEQDALVGCFGRYLHSLTAPVQVLIRTQPLDLSAQVAELRERAPSLPHPALETAALEHADYLAQLGKDADLLRRQVLLILREPLHPSPSSSRLRVLRRHHDRDTHEAVRRAADTRLVRRLGEAAELLASAGIVVSILDAGQATAVLSAACDPDSQIPTSSASLAGTDDIITTAPYDDRDDGRDGDQREWST